MEDEQNPDKIPMNPIQQTVVDNKLYENPQLTSSPERKPVINGMFKRHKQPDLVPFKYKLVLVAMMLVFLLLAVIIGKVLFKDGLS